MDLSRFNFFYDTFIAWGIQPHTANYLNLVFLLLLSLLLSYAVGKIGRNVVIRLATGFSARTSSVFDDFLLKYHFPKYVASIPPYFILTLSIPLIFADFPQWINSAGKLADIYLTITVVLISRSGLFALRDYLKTKDAFKDKPVESFIQVVTIFMYLAVGIVLFSLLTGKSPWAFLTAMGAASAILLLVFKDTILGFVASIQVASNDMVRIGDWITMEKYGADGDVTEINLTTVKVRNWDKTITTIPTYYLISDSFKNWRGMQDAGGRRIKRSIYIKISSIRHLSQNDINNLGEVDLLKGYLSKRTKEIQEYNAEKGYTGSCLINGYNLTNIGVFRRYINAYLLAHPDIHKDMTIMVRQLSPSITGIPIEIYAFSSDIRWQVYEDIMSDIFDHLLASVNYFGLEVFEMPGADDVRAISLHQNIHQH